MKQHHRSLYQAYLRSNSWHVRRRMALHYARWKCQLCGASSSRRARLEVHHSNYETLGDERIEDLHVLCSQCHAKHHERFANPQRSLFDEGEVA